MVRINVRILEFRFLFCPIPALAVKIASRRDSYVILGRFVVQPLEMVFADPKTNADYTDGDPVIRAYRTARSRRLIGAIKRSFEQRDRSDSGGSGSRFLDKLPARDAGRLLRLILAHKKK